MPSKGQSVTIYYLAQNNGASPPAGETGDVSNHTLKLIKDGTEASPTNSPAEVDSTNCPGLYKLVLTSAEATFNVVCLHGKSSTSGVQIIPTTIAFENLPTAAPAAANGLPTLGTGAGQINPTNGSLTGGNVTSGGPIPFTANSTPQTLSQQAAAGKKFLSLNFNIPAGGSLNFVVQVVLATGGNPIQVFNTSNAALGPNDSNQALNILLKGAIAGFQISGLTGSGSCTYSYSVG